MSFLSLTQFALSTCCFIAAAMMGKAWALAPSMGKILVTMALYTVGNLLMLRLIRLFGMATAFSLSAVLQLVAVNAVALLFYKERLGTVQGTGMVLAVVAVALITLGPSIP